MNEVYRSDTMVVHDDRTPLTFKQAFDILLQGNPVFICYPPDFSAENECDIYDPEYKIFITDIITPELFNKQPKKENEKQIYEYLRGYEIYK